MSDPSHKDFRSPCFIMHGLKTVMASEFRENTHFHSCEIVFGLCTQKYHMRKLKVVIVPVLDQIQSQQEIHSFLATAKKQPTRKVLLVA